MLSLIGTIAPNFSLLGANGKVVRSEDLLALGPVILKFFRGRWCPYDITELETWEALLPELRHPPEGRPALFVAISPQTPRQNAFTAQPHGKPLGFTFPMLSDPEAQLAARFGLDYVVPEGSRAWYRSMLVNIPMLYGNESWRLPLPATIVLNAEGRIVFLEAYADHRLRPDPQTVLQALYAISPSREPQPELG